MPRPQDVADRSSAEGPRSPLGRLDWERTDRCYLTLRADEMEDIRRIAAAWRVPVATACWVLVHDQLRRLRRVGNDLGPEGLTIAASAAVLRGTWGGTRPCPDMGASESALPKG